MSRKLGISLEHRIGTNPHADGLLRLRQLILYLVFGIYIAVLLYIVIFSRHAYHRHLVNTRFMYDLMNSITIDTGIFGFIKELLVQGFSEGFSHIHLNKPEDISQVVMNIMLYVPMSYLLPYTFRKVRNNKRYTILICFLASFMTENLQLIFKRGFYDLDDIFFNVVGGAIGYKLYMIFAYCVTHPDWRKEQRLMYRWRLRAYKKTLYKYKMALSTQRVIIKASSEDEIRSFYVDKLGFQLKGLWFSETDPSSSLLLKLGSIYIEARCANEAVELPEQSIRIRSPRLGKLKKRLEENDIATSCYEEDIFSHRKGFSITGPDKVTIVFNE